MDLRRYGTLNQKKSICVAAAELDFETLGAVTASFQLFNLPENAVITNAYVHVVTASDAATSNVGIIGTAEDGTQVLSAADLKTLGEQGTFTGQSLTGTGKTIWFKQTVTGAATVGKFLVVVEYLEYSLNTGNYTN